MWAAGWRNPRIAGGTGRSHATTGLCVGGWGSYTGEGSARAGTDWLCVVVGWRLIACEDEAGAVCSMRRSRIRHVALSRWYGQRLSSREVVPVWRENGFAECIRGEGGRPPYRLEAAEAADTASFLASAIALPMPSHAFAIGSAIVLLLVSHRQTITNHRSEPGSSGNSEMM